MGTVAARRSRSEREGLLTCLIADARSIEPRSAVRAVVRGFHDNDLLTYASAISFQVFFALVPLALVGLGMLGVVGLSDVWHDHIAPDVRANLPADAYRLINDTVSKVLGEKRLFWITLGVAIAVWEVSGAMRATMQVLNRVYDVPERRTFRRKLIDSIGLSSVVALLLLLSVASTKLGAPALESLVGDGPARSALAVLASWVVAIALMFASVGLVVRYAPDTRRPLRWVSFGGVLVIAGWVAMSLVYGFYISSVADYGSIFGGLALVMVTMTYIYLSTIVFLTGVQLDSLIRHQVEYR